MDFWGLVYKGPLCPKSQYIQTRLQMAHQTWNTVELHRPPDSLHNCLPSAGSYCLFAKGWRQLATQMPQPHENQSTIEQL